MALQVLSPMPGRVAPLAEVPDPMFAEAMLGPGLAIAATGVGAGDLLAALRNQDIDGFAMAAAAELMFAGAPGVEFETGVSVEPVAALATALQEVVRRQRVLA